MNCAEIEERDIADRCLLDLLGESERDEFEAHYFECKACFLELQTRRAVQDALRLQPTAAAPAVPRWFGAQAWAPALAALFLLMGIGIWLRTRTPSPSVIVSSSPRPGAPLPSPAALLLERLARVAPPRYVAVTLRGPEGHAQEKFRKAMEYYADGDYAKAIGGLRNAASASPSTPAYSFYLGACYLLTRQVDHAVDALRNTVALGDSPYLESAHFLLGKAHLVEGRMLAAKEELQTTIRLRGSNEAEAMDILGQLPK